jgi:Domain of unknown function (DUF4301)
MLSEEKRKLIEEYKNSPDAFDIPPEKIFRQIEIFEKGVPFIQLAKPALVGDGILKLTETEEEKFIKIGEEEIYKGRVTKFVPASGAASRMFKKLQACLSDNNEILLNELKQKAESGDENSKAAFNFVLNIQKFAFGEELFKILERNKISDPTWQKIIEFVVGINGLDYSNSPKGSILFHNYPEGPRTAFEEHLSEAINFAMSSEHQVKIHFTISPEHEELFNLIIKKFVDSKKNDQIKFNIQYSFQKKSTNTIAVSSENKILRDENELPIFRPAGHGALLENLNDLIADIIILKNIDNVAQDYLKDDTYRFKKILIGILSTIQQKVFNYLSALQSSNFNQELIAEIASFAKSVLFLSTDNSFYKFDENHKRDSLIKLLNRPIRVCGMVKNEGEPGGGPFWVTENAGNLSLQVVESAQINSNDSNQKKIFASSTHFSPVDFVCGVKDYQGNNFNLHNFVDPDTFLLTKKSKDGKELKALELPGLWNGGMAGWITIFVEVPLTTFNPVKEVNDLLKPAHQPKQNG